VGLLSRLFTAAVKRIEASRGYQAVAEQHERTEPFERAARGLAYSTLSDDEACARLREWIGTVDDVVWEAVESSARSRGDYVHDRAYRLLSAAANYTLVEPIDPASADLFREEENLGRLPLGEAFDLLAAREPKLAQLRSEAELEAATRPPEGRQQGHRDRNGKVQRILIERRCHADDPLLGTLLARLLAAEYLRAISNVGPPPRDVTTPFFQGVADTHLGQRPARS
jgi:hypothetical protein